jgi:hypothetical protein
VLQRSPIFARLAKGNVPLVNYVIMGDPYNKGYYLADGIYLEWPIFVKTSHEPKEDNYKRFVKEHEVCRKNVERAFGVL